MANVKARPKVKDALAYFSIQQKIWVYDVGCSEMLNEESKLEGEEIFLIELPIPEDLKNKLKEIYKIVRIEE